jgi:hypothetical protein
VNAPQLVALIRAGAAFVNGKDVERSDDHSSPTAAKDLDPQVLTIAPRRRSPTVSLRYRHEYAAVLPRGLPSSFRIPPRSYPTPPQERVRTASGPDPPGSSRCPFERRNNAGSSRTPLRPARRTRTIWQYWHVPALSGLLPTLPGTTRIRLPSAPLSRCDKINGEGLPPPLEPTKPHGANEMRARSRSVRREATRSASARMPSRWKVSRA